MLVGSGLTFRTYEMQEHRCVFSFFSTESRWDCRCHRICFDTELSMVLMPHQRNVLLAVTASKYELT